MKQSFKMASLRSKITLLLALCLLLSGLGGCTKTGAPQQSEASSAVGMLSQSTAESSAPAVASEVFASASAEKSDGNQALPRQELDDETAALLDGEDHCFEREIAYRYYHKGESREELTDTERNRWMAQSNWCFDESGNGVFVVDVDSGMSQTWYYFEYTEDFGETWTGAGVYNLVTWIDDIKIAGNRVVISVGNGVTDSGHSLVYSDDLCQTFYERDILDFAPDSLTAVLQEDPLGPRHGYFQH